MEEPCLRVLYPKQYAETFNRRIHDSPPTVSLKHLQEVHNCLNELFLNNDHLKRIMHLLNDEMQFGLENEKEATIKMLNSFVRAGPNGTEQGNFLALDLGGTNFRVLLVKLDPTDEAHSKMESMIFRVPHNIMTGNGEALFDHIATCLAEFIEQFNLEGQKLPLGFTFSFPCYQKALNHGTLVTWTKGFNCSGVEGEDVVRLLSEAIIRHGKIDVHIVALLNDTVGTQLACALEDNRCAAAVIAGTGTNACYFERICRVSKEIFDDPDPDAVIINTEWGAFGDNGALDFVLTKFDKEVDKSSINPGVHIFEKMISGMFLGEITRRILLDLIKKGLIFDEDAIDVFEQPGCFPTKFIDLQDEEQTFQATFQIVEELDIIGISMQDCANVAYVCAAVSQRAAYLNAAGIAVLINRMQRPFATVGIDGSLYRFHPTFHLMIDYKFSCILSQDGSGRGAALVAAVATRLANEKYSS